MGLGNLYVEALENSGYGRGWMINWPLQTRVEIGDVGQVVRDVETGIWGFRPGATLDHVGIPHKVESHGVAGDAFHTYGDGTQIAFGFDATTPGWEWLGDASAGFHATFGSSGGLQANMDNIRRRKVDNIDGLKAELLEAVSRGSLSVGQSIVVEDETADLAMIIASESKSGDLKVTTNGAIAPVGQPLAKFATDFSVKSASGGAITQPMTARFPVAFRDLVIGTRGIWWWKRVEILGAANLSDADWLLAAEDALEDADYFARF